jgi:hypothetical protein
LVPQRRFAQGRCGVLEQPGQFGARIVVEGEERRTDRPGRVADERARGLDGGRVALALEEVAERPQFGQEVAGGARSISSMSRRCSAAHCSGMIDAVP